MELAQRFRDFALREAGDNSPLYHQRALDISTDPEVLALIDRLPTDKQQPNLILAAARVNGAIAVPYSEFRDQLRENWSAISATAQRRRTQTNEAGRATTLLPVLPPGFAGGHRGGRLVGRPAAPSREYGGARLVPALDDEP